MLILFKVTYIMCIMYYKLIHFKMLNRPTKYAIHDLVMYYSAHEYIK